MERKAGRKRLCLRCHREKEARSTTGKRHKKKLLGENLAALILIDICPLLIVFIVHLSHFQLFQNSKSTWPECTKLDVIEIDLSSPTFFIENSMLRTCNSRSMRKFKWAKYKILHCLHDL